MAMCDASSARADANGFVPAETACSGWLRRSIRAQYSISLCAISRQVRRVLSATFQWRCVLRRAPATQRTCAVAMIEWHWREEEPRRGNLLLERCAGVCGQEAAARCTAHTSSVALGQECVCMQTHSGIAFFCVHAAQTHAATSTHPRMCAVDESMSQLVSAGYRRWAITYVHVLV